MKTERSKPTNQITTSFFSLLIILFSSNVFSQGVAISNSASNAPAAGSMLHVYGTTRIGSENSADGVLIFNNATNAKTITISPGVTGISYGLVLPPMQATGPNHVLLNDGAGNLSWGPPTAGTEWQLLGNAGTNPAINFLGTTDAQPLRLATSGTERLRINAAANEVGIGMTAAANNTLDITNTTTTGKGINVTANALTTGSGLNVSSSSAALGTSGSIGSFTLSGSNAANAGTVLKVSNSGTLNTGVAMMITNAASGKSFRVNDDGTDTDASPFIIDNAGNVGIGLETPASKFDVRNGDLTLSNSGTAGALLFQGTSTGQTSIKAGAQGATNISYVLPTAQGTSGDFLVNDGSGNLSWGDIPATVASFDVSQGASSVTSQTISSTSDVNVNDMVISVPPGVYMIWFSSDIINGNNSNSCTVTIYTNGTANSSTERTFGGMVKRSMVSAMGVVTVTGTAPMEIRVKAKVDSNNATFYKRSLMGLKIG
ncbi:MAG: hypothetical protein AB7G44_08065 [Bacteroidia bacterium]